MKKLSIKIITVLILLTLAIAWIQSLFYLNNDKNLDSIYTSDISKDGEVSEKISYSEKIQKKKELSLNSRLDLYNSWKFEKVEIEDNKNLNGYIFLWESEESNILPFIKAKITKNYYLVNTKKPADTSLIDLWFNLTWNTKINTITNEQCFWTEILKEFGWFIVVLIIFMIWLRLLLWKSGWAGWIMDIKVWKKSTKESSKTRFSDVAGMEEVKNELIEIVDYLKDPEKYRKVWARPPKWVLLFGAPGSGKTLLARAVAGEADVAFFSASGSEFMEMLVWMWAAKVRALFKEAKEAWRAIIFIDEIDAIWKKRGNWTTGWHQEQEQTLNQILTEMDGFDKQTNIIVMAATNRPDTLDPALLRAWRFDRKIYVTEPTSEERTEIFGYYLKDKKISEDVDIQSLVRRTSGYVWADIENIVNEASLKIAKENRTILEPNDFEYALEKVAMWPEKKVKKMKDIEKKIITFHELGHALLGHIQPDADPVEKISIVRRWEALWLTWYTPTEDRHLYSKRYLRTQIIELLWWRASEEIFIWADEITTGASNDLERASNIIRWMLTKYWMNSDLWLAVYNDQSDYNFCKPYSEATALKIDETIKDFLNQCYEEAKKQILAHKDEIEKIAEILLQKEYLSGKDFADMIDHPELIEKFAKQTEESLKKKEESETKKTEKIKSENTEEKTSDKKDSIKEWKNSDKKDSPKKSDSKKSEK